MWWVDVEVSWGGEPLLRETFYGSRSLRLPGGAELILHANARGAKLPKLRLANGTELDVLANAADLDAVANGADLDVLANGGEVDLTSVPPLAVELTAICDEPYRSVAARVPVTARLHVMRRPSRTRRFAPPSRTTLIGIAVAVLMHVTLFVSTLCKPALAADEPFIERREPVATIRFLSLDFAEPLVCFPEFEPVVRSNDDKATVFGSQGRGRMGATTGNLPPEEQVGCRRAVHVHVVREGETLTSIARLYGFDSFRDLYRQDVNPSLIAERPDPNRIFPGDPVVIPDEDTDGPCLIEP